MGTTGYLAFFAAHALILNVVETGITHHITRHPQWDEVNTSSHHTGSSLHAISTSSKAGSDKGDVEMQLAVLTGARAKASAAVAHDGVANANALSLPPSLANQAGGKDVEQAPHAKSITIAADHAPDGTHHASNEDSTGVLSVPVYEGGVHVGRASEANARTESQQGRAASGNTLRTFRQRQRRKRQQCKSCEPLAMM